MKQGTLGEQYLKQSVFPYIHKQNKMLEIGPNIGNDYSSYGGMITSDGVGEEPIIAWNKAMNNYLCSGDAPLGSRLQIILPRKVRDSAIKRHMASFEALSQQDNIQIVGGHTEVSDTVNVAQFIVTMFGVAHENKQTWIPDKKHIDESTEIVVAGYVGILGTNRLLREQNEQLVKMFSNRFLVSSLFSEQAYSIRPLIETAMEAVDRDNLQIHYMHDASDGGVYGALWQMSRWMGRGFGVENKAIPIRQQTIEICEIFDRNPYMIDGTGAVVIACEKGHLLVNRMREKGMQANVVGKIGKESQCIIYFGDDEKRVLTPNY